MGHCLGKPKETWSHIRIECLLSELLEQFKPFCPGTTIYPNPFALGKHVNNHDYYFVSESVWNALHSETLEFIMIVKVLDPFYSQSIVKWMMSGHQTT